ncbi:metallophosphoesterase [Bremerella sp. JC817]|uniref:metallophosphoesterase family protein n=1 Tax=Bremerella sp. JC817 TaxID=3231756 RepID=UPI003458E87D
MLRFGLLTDIHYAEKDAAGDRFYQESLGKVNEAVDYFNQQNLPLAIELGDLIDSADSLEKEVGHLRKIEDAYARFQGERHYVLGNHCVHTLKKEEFLQHTGMKAPHQSFDVGQFHFVILDACYTSDGKSYGRGKFVWTDTNIPDSQQKWLAEDLAKTNKPTLVFVHQRLDLDAPNHYAIGQSAAIRKILVDSKKVQAVFSGHSHANFHTSLQGIHYTVIRAVVTGSGQSNNGYALVNLFEDGSLKIEGKREQAAYSLT